MARNFTFRTLGGRSAVPVSARGRAALSYYLIHNAGVFADESADYIRARTEKDDRHADAQAIVPAYDIVRHALATSARLQVASIKIGLGLAPQAPFDMAYVKALFSHAYRQGRMARNGNRRSRD